MSVPPIYFTEKAVNNIKIGYVTKPSSDNIKLKYIQEMILLKF